MAWYLQDNAPEKTIMKRILLAYILLTGLIGTSSAQNIALMQNEGDVFVPISKYISKGDASGLSAWFADNLEVIILGRSSECCSKTQAREIMNTFFESNRPQSFQLIHKSGEGQMKHAIGRLISGNHRYSVTISVLIDSSGNHIQILRIDYE